MLPHVFDDASPVQDSSNGSENNILSKSAAIVPLFSTVNS